MFAGVTPRLPQSEHLRTCIHHLAEAERERSERLLLMMTMMLMMKAPMTAIDTTVSLKNPLRCAQQQRTVYPVTPFPPSYT